MVATSGRWGHLAPSLVEMVNEADRLAPHRSHASDGSLGDSAHAARSSFHNPSGGYVDALDLTHDPAHGWDAHARARAVVKRGDARLDHVISNRQIWSRAHPYWRTYSGPNPHTKHAHFAVRRNATGRFPTHAWWPTSAAALPKPPAPTITEDTMYEIMYFKSATGPIAAYRCLTARTGTGAKLVWSAVWIENEVQLEEWERRGVLYGNKPETALAPRVSIEIHNGPYDNTKVY